MKFSVVAAVATGAALASASPLRVIVVSSNVNAVAEPNNPFSKVRFGHAVHDPNVAQMMEGGPPGRAPDAPWPFPPGPPGGPPHPHDHFPHFPHPPPNMRPGRPCGGMRRPGGFKQKAIDISNAFRKTFGLPLIETHLELTPVFEHHHQHGGPVDVGSGGKEIHGGMVHIMPFIGAPKDTWGNDDDKGNKKFSGLVNYPPGGPGGPPGGPHHHYPPLPPPPPPPPPPFFWPPPPHRHHGHHGPHHGLQMMDVDVDDSFMVRLQNALMSLGPWEGRAVAFVVGAGLGVLLRMFWVLGVVAYRGCSSTDGKEYAAINDEDSDDDDDDDNVVLGTRYNRRTPVSAPPQYVYPVDEKVRVEEETTTTEVQKSPAAPVAGDN